MRGEKSLETHSTFRDSFLASFSVGEELSFSKPMNIFDSDYTREIEDWSSSKVSATEQANKSNKIIRHLLYLHRPPPALPLPLTSMFRLTSSVIMLDWKRGHL